MSHIPVLLKEVVQLLDATPGEIVIDATLGGGGHAQTLAAQVGPRGLVLGIDADQEAVDRFNKSNLAENIRAVRGNFSQLDKVAAEAGIPSVDIILFDLGFSSAQMDSPERGFSFQKAGPLDMRLDRQSGQTAADIVNKFSESELAKLIREYGEEINAKKIARAIVAARAAESLTTTDQLFDLIKLSLPAKLRYKAGDVARRTFQALRIAVNDELEMLKQALPKAFALLNPGGRMAVISFHSLEDKIVKKYFQSLSKGCLCPPEFPVCVCGHNAEAAVLTRKVVRPTVSEQEANPRSKSAKLRVVRKLSQ